MQTFAAKTPRIGVSWTHSAQKSRAEQLAKLLDLPLVSTSEHLDFLLNCTTRHLELSCPGNPSITGSVRVDFVHGPIAYRRKHGGREGLIRALGSQKNKRAIVMDATGGWGSDAFVMASHGYHVLLIERNPIVAAMLQDGLRRASEHSDTKETISRIQLIIGNCLQVMEEFRIQEKIVDIIYLDPMFPERSKSAKVKKKLQILQMLVGKGGNIDQLFTAALQTAHKRVVVKRPKSAPPLEGSRPSHSYSGKTTRFDVYIKKNPNDNTL